MAKAKDVDPLKLKRERPGRYVTTDGRFAVEGESTGSWYVIHNERENELGLPLMAGPFATLDDARSEIATAAAAPADDGGPSAGPPVRPKPAPKPTSNAKSPPAPALRVVPDPTPAPAPAPDAIRRPARPEPESTDPAWLTRLPANEQKEARRLLGLLERLGIEDPSLARREVEGNVPEIARTLLARRVRAEALDGWQNPDAVASDALGLAKRVRRHLRAIVEPMVDAAQPTLTTAGPSDELAAFAWLVAVRTAAGVFEALESEGRTPPAPGQPGWRLVELDARGEPTGRPIVVDESDLLEP